MAQFRIRHLTKYSYEIPVRDSANQIMLYPIDDTTQEVVQHDIRVSGDPSISLHIDYFGNEVGTFMQSQPHTRLIIDSKMIVLTKPVVFPEDSRSATDQWQTLESLKKQLPLIDFGKAEKFDAQAEVLKIVESEIEQSMTPFQVAQHLCKYIFENFKYEKGITTVETTLDEIWEIKSGVCQDFAHMLVAMLQLAGVPARYVSGYVCAGKSTMRGDGATHAWVEAYIPDYGWIGLDPTNNCLADEPHVKLAIGKRFSDCSPVKGTYRGSSHHIMEVTVNVAYEDGQTVEETEEVILPETAGGFTRNSFQRHKEIQIQQQQ